VSVGRRKGEKLRTKRTIGDPKKFHQKRRLVLRRPKLIGGHQKRNRTSSIKLKRKKTFSSKGDRLKTARDPGVDTSVQKGWGRRRPRSGWARRTTWGKGEMSDHLDRGTPLLRRDRGRRPRAKAVKKKSRKKDEKGPLPARRGYPQKNPRTGTEA